MKICMIVLKKRYVFGIETGSIWEKTEIALVKKRRQLLERLINKIFRIIYFLYVQTKNVLIQTHLKLF